MKKQSKMSAIVAVLSLAFVALACSFGDETEKANKLVDEGNAAVQEAHKEATAGDEKKDKMMGEVSAISNQSQLEHARNTAREVIAAYDKAKEKCNEVARKYEEASKLKINDQFKEYLTMKVKEFQKRAEAAEAAKGSSQALIDTESRSEFQNKAKASGDQITKLLAEAQDIAGQADKFQREHKESFKS
jgi:membrane-associated HD superfamily phosphohydrolase